MGSIIDRISQLNIEVTSPDRTVSGQLTMRAGMSIRFAEDIRRWHDEDTLAAQVEAVLRGLVAGQRRAAHMLRGTTEPDPSEKPRTPAAQRAAKLAEAIAEQDVSAESTDGNVLIRQTGADDFIVVIVPGSLHRIPQDALRAEVQSALFTVRREFGRNARQLNEQFYSSRGTGARR